MIEVNAELSESYNGRLYSYVMYANTRYEDMTIIRVSKSNCRTCDLYVSFNHLVSDSQEGFNMILLHSKEASIYAKMPANSYTYLEMDTMYQLMVKVGEIDIEAGFAEIYVGPPK